MAKLSEKLKEVLSKVMLKFMFLLNIFNMVQLVNDVAENGQYYYHAVNDG